MIKTSDNTPGLTQTESGLILLMSCSQLSHEVCTVITGIIRNYSWQLEYKKCSLD